MGAKPERSSRGGFAPPEGSAAPEAHRARRRRLRGRTGGLAPPRALPQQAWRVDNDFTRLFHGGNARRRAETPNLDAASFAQMEEAACAGGASDGDAVSREVAHIVLRTVSDRGKQHNPVTGSGGMLLGRVLQAGDGHPTLRPGDRIASLVQGSRSLRCASTASVPSGGRARRSTSRARPIGSSRAARRPLARRPPLERAALAALDVASRGAAGRALSVSEVQRAGSPSARAAESGDSSCG